MIIYTPQQERNTFLKSPKNNKKKKKICEEENYFDRYLSVFLNPFYSIIL